MLFALTRRHCLRTVPAVDPSAFMAGGAWGLRTRQLTACSTHRCTGHQSGRTRSVRRLPARQHPTGNQLLFTSAQSPLPIAPPMYHQLLHRWIATNSASPVPRAVHSFRSQRKGLGKRTQHQRKKGLLTNRLFEPTNMQSMRKPRKWPKSYPPEAATPAKQGQ